MSHKRTVHRVTFHNKEPALLLSGSQDGDMKIFDIRRKDVSKTFSAKESVRDVQFCPHSSGYFRFAAGLENGIVQEWDIRRPDRPDREIIAHTGPVFTLDWNPMDKNWLATGGRDRAIRVWDMPTKKVVHIVHTMASVARCKWRPDYKYLIASSSLLVDFAVNIWDIRRPYIPLAAFNRHKDVASGIQWRNSPNILLSCGRDGYLCQNIFKEAQHPLDHINRVGVNISKNGDVAQAVSEQLLKPYRDQISEIHKPTKQFYSDEASTSSPSSEHYMWAKSNLYLFLSDSSPDFSMDWFINTANMYKLNGKSFEEICDHNASVAQRLNRKQVYLTWMILKGFYSCTSPSNLTPPYHSSPGYSDLSDKPDMEKIGKIADATPKKSCGENTSGCSEEESDLENEVQETGLASQTGDFFFGEGDFFFGEGDTDFSYDREDADSVLHDRYNWSLPVEPFQPRHELDFSNVPPVPPPHYSPASDSDDNSFQATSHNHKETISNGAAVNDLNINVKLPIIPQWDYSSLVTDMLVAYAEEDIQSTVSMLIVLGDRIQPEIDLKVRTSWFLSYIGM
ncbi:GATOR complex protein WDR24-like [Octopus sinensis]|uniref:GATOR2 complex protein WDR24 n=1 Tax=Octopus sinensis TaxID=2607531 RepID=A0A7E6FFZ1_9MOLL|nr:GATOR complex protein WDR24-like [Octopus sinensis]